MKMKVIVVGATGTIGKTVVKALEGEFEVIKAASKSGDFAVDITSPSSIESFFKKVGAFDALVSATGFGHFGPFETTGDKEFRKGIDSKLMGQINLVLTGQHFINDGGSFTLTSGIVDVEPILQGSNLTTVNAGINAFVLGAAIEFKNGVRINAVSPGVVEDSPGMFGLFPGYVPLPMKLVANAYVRSIKGALTGQVFRIG